MKDDEFAGVRIPALGRYQAVQRCVQMGYDPGDVSEWGTPMLDAIAALHKRDPVEARQLERDEYRAVEYEQRLAAFLSGLDEWRAAPSAEELRAADVERQLAESREQALVARARQIMREHTQELEQRALAKAREEMEAQP